MSHITVQEQATDKSRKKDRERVFEENISSFTPFSPKGGLASTPSPFILLSPSLHVCQHTTCASCLMIHRRRKEQRDKIGRACIRVCVCVCGGLTVSWACSGWAWCPGRRRCSSGCFGASGCGSCCRCRCCCCSGRTRRTGCFGSGPGARTPSSPPRCFSSLPVESSHKEVSKQ